MTSQRHDLWKRLAALVSIAPANMLVLLGFGCNTINPKLEDESMRPLCIKSTLPIITTDKLDDVREYYLDYFDFKVTFEQPGKFIGLESEMNKEIAIAFSAPSGESQPYSGHGVTLCFQVDNADAEFQRLTEAGLPIVVPLQDNPWGDRSFISIDPAGVSVYVHSPIEVSDEFKRYFKSPRGRTCGEQTAFSV